MTNPLALSPLTGHAECVQWLHKWLEKPAFSTEKMIKGERVARPTDHKSSGYFPLALLLGETGSGKTRLAAEASCLATTMSYHQVWVTGQTMKMAIPYSSFYEFLEILIRQISKKLLAELLKEVGIADDCSELPYPQLAKCFLPQSSEGLSLEMSLHHWNTLGLFIEAYQRRLGPLLFIIDDLHWVDQKSLALIAYLLQSQQTKTFGKKEGDGKREISETRVPLHILATAHSGLLQSTPALRVWVARLERMKLLNKLQIPPLGQADVARLVHWNCASTISDKQATVLAKQVYTLSQGNPFFASEFLRLYTHHGRLAKLGFDSSQELQDKDASSVFSVENLSHIPELIAAALEEALLRISDACNEWLNTVAVIGYEFDFVTAHLLWSLSREQDDVTCSDRNSKLNDEDYLEEALAAALIYEVPALHISTEGHQREGSRYRFWHPLLTHYLQLKLPKPRLLRLRSLVKQAIEVRSTTESSGSAFERHSPLLSIDSAVQNKELPLSYTYDASSNERSHALFLLTSKELEILSLLAAGSNTKEIAEGLCLSTATVRTHIRNLLRKLGVSSRLNAVLLWQKYTKTTRTPLGTDKLLHYQQYDSK